MATKNTKVQESAVRTANSRPAGVAAIFVSFRDFRGHSNRSPPPARRPQAERLVIPKSVHKIWG